MGPPRAERPEGTGSLVAEGSCGWSQGSAEPEVLPRRLAVGLPIQGNRAWLEVGGHKGVSGLRLAEVFERLDKRGHCRE